MPYGTALPSSGMAKSCTRTGSGCPLGRNSRPPFLKSPTSFSSCRQRSPAVQRLECFHRGIDMLELSVAVGVVGSFARLVVGLQAEVETLQQAADQLLTGDEASLGQRRGEMALAQADPPQRSLRVTADRRLHQFLQSFQDPGLHLDRGLLSTTPAANPLAASHRPGPEVRQTAAYGASGNSGGPRNRNNSAAAGSACFTGREQASVSFVEERSECIVACPDGILVDHPT